MQQHEVRLLWDEGGEVPVLNVREPAVTGNVMRLTLTFKSPGYLLFSDGIMYRSDTHTYVYD
jgi:hypothetical protein